MANRPPAAWRAALLPAPDAARALTGGSRQRVRVAGGGVAALEALLCLRVVGGERLAIELLAPDVQFSYRPASVSDPFGRGGAPQFDLDEIVAEQGAGRIPAALARVDAEAKVAFTGGGRGSPLRPAARGRGGPPRRAVAGSADLPGRRSRGATMRGLLGELELGRARSVAFALAPGVSWPLPLYELALLTAIHLSARGVSAEVHVVTARDRAAGPVRRVAEQASGGADAGPRHRAAHLQQAGLLRGWHARARGRGPRALDRVVAMPRLVGPWLDGLPHDAWGFIPVDAHGLVSGDARRLCRGRRHRLPAQAGRDRRPAGRRRRARDRRGGRRRRRAPRLPARAARAPAQRRPADLPARRAWRGEGSGDRAAVRRASPGPSGRSARRPTRARSGGRPARSPRATSAPISPTPGRCRWARRRFATAAGPRRRGERRARTPGSSWRSCSPTPTPGAATTPSRCVRWRAAEALAGDCRPSTRQQAARVRRRH